MSQPLFWAPKTVLHTIVGIQPHLASWDNSTHPSQIRLQTYRQPILEELLPVLPQEQPLFLHLDVDVGRQEHLLKHHDLENCLTPLFGVKYLNADRFFLVTARKFVGGGSRLDVGIAQPAIATLFTAGWDYFAYSATGSTQTKQWKENLRSALTRTNPVPVNSSAVEVQISWVCSPNRNWKNLWKPTGDCMGPILGEENALRPFAPNDDRITSLQFHRGLDDTLGNNVIVHMWWRAA